MNLLTISLMQLMKIKSILYILFYLSIVSCANKNEDVQLEYINTNIDIYTPILKDFLVENSFCTKEEEISIGLEMFLKSMSEGLLLTDLKTFEVPETVCKNFIDEGIYDAIWNIDTTEVVKLSALKKANDENTEIDITKTLNLESDYFKWLITNRDNFQKIVQEMIDTRSNIPNYPTILLLRNTYSNDNNIKISFDDKVLIRIVIVEFIFDYLSLNCK